MSTEFAILEHIDPSLMQSTNSVSNSKNPMNISPQTNDAKMQNLMQSADNIQPKTGLQTFQGKSIPKKEITSAPMPDTYDEFFDTSMQKKGTLE